MKPTSLFRGQPSFDRDAFKRTALYSLAFLFAAHAFCFFNLTYSGNSVMLNVSKGYNEQIACGHYLQPIYWQIRGSLSSPLFVGMLSALYLSLLNLVLVWLLELHRPLSLFALCGATTANAAILSVCAASLHTADASFLALLLAALACACCTRLRLGILPGSLLLTAALALDAGSCAYFAALALIVLLSDLILTRHTKATAAGAVSCLLALAAAIVLHQLGHMLMLRRSGIQSSTALSLFGGHPLSAYRASVSAMLSPLTAYHHLSVVIRVLLAAFSLLLIVRSARTHGKTTALLLGIGALALPLFCSMTFLSAQAGLQITSAHCLLDVLPIVLLSHLLPRHKAGNRLLFAAFSILFAGSIVFSNQVYLKKNLEFESTLSFMSRVVSRLEEMPGYFPGHTPVAVIGTPEESVFSSQRKGFEHLSVLDAARSNFAVSSDSDMIWYMWEVMGYPLNFVSTYELEQLKLTEEAASLPAFPQEGCCAFIGDTLVIRISE